MDFVKTIGIGALVMLQGCVGYRDTGVVYRQPGMVYTGPPPRTQITAGVAQYTLNKHVEISSTKPILVSEADTKHRGIASSQFGAVSYFIMTFQISSATGNPLRIAVQGLGGYRADYVAGWSAVIGQSGARCVVYRTDLLGIEVKRQGLELPTALPGMGETATANMPTVVYPGAGTTVAATFSCNAPIRVGQLVSGQLQLLIEQNGRWGAEALAFDAQPIISR